MTPGEQRDMVREFTERDRERVDGPILREYRDALTAIVKERLEHERPK